MNGSRSNHARKGSKHARTRRPTPREGGAHQPQRRSYAPIAAVVVALAVAVGVAGMLYARSQAGGQRPPVAQQASPDAAKGDEGTGASASSSSADDAAKDGDGTKSDAAKGEGTSTTGASAAASKDSGSANKDGSGQASASGKDAQGADSATATPTTGSETSAGTGGAQAGASGPAGATGPGDTAGGSGGAGTAGAVASQPEPTFAEPAYVEPSAPPAYVSRDWMWGEACASDVAEAGTITASQIPFDDDEPQVALEYGPGVASYFGSYVEVRYNNKVVRAQVVDCGAYSGGAGGIMINPAVFEQFGVTSVDEWGRRMVEYRLV